MLALISILSKVQGQETMLKNELRLSFFKVEVAPETLNDVYMPRWVNGFVYKRSIRDKFRPFVGIDFGRRRVRDHKPAYEYAYEGRGRLTETRLKLGFSYHTQEVLQVRPFIEIEAYSSFSTYRGSFESNLNQHQVIVDNSYVRIGGILKGGLTYSITSRFDVNAAMGMRFESPELNEESKTDFITNNAVRPRTWIPIEITTSYWI